MESSVIRKKNKEKGFFDAHPITILLGRASLKSFFCFFYSGDERSFSSFVWDVSQA
jgi:hypothetical protein